MKGISNQSNAQYKANDQFSATNKPFFTVKKPESGFPKKAITSSTKCADVGPKPNFIALDKKTVRKGP
jgi:hypothetical protein